MSDLRQVDFKYELLVRKRFRRNVIYAGIALGLLAAALAYLMK